MFLSACPLDNEGDQSSTINPLTTHASSGPAADNPPTVPAIAYPPTVLQHGGMELMESIFGEDSDNEIQDASNSNFFQFQILSADNEESNRILLQQEIHNKLHEHYRRAIKDFQLTIETVFRYIEYKLPFQTFFIICESAPYTFYNQLLEKDISVKQNRTVLIEGAKKYLNQLCLSMFKFLKQLNYNRQCQNLEINILEGLFPEVSVREKESFLETLNRPAILRTIFSATREEELLVNISAKTFKSFKFSLIREITDNVIEHSDKGKDWIVSDNNIQTILSNCEDFELTPAKVKSIRKALKEFISDENPLQHRYPTRSKDEGTSIVSYFGQDSTAATGKRKRSLSKDDEAVEDSIAVVEDDDRLKSPEKRSSEFVNPDNAHQSDPFETATATAEMDHRQISADISPAVEEHEPTRSPELRSSECFKPAESAAPDDQMEVDDVKETERNHKSDPIETATVGMDLQPLSADISPAVEEHEPSRSLELRSSECFKPAESAVPDDHFKPAESALPDDQMGNFNDEIDNLARFQESAKLDTGTAKIDHQITESTSPELFHECKTADHTSFSHHFVCDTFNEDDSLFLNTTSHSKVSSVNDLIVSLSHQVREIKAICARFGIDFNHLSAFEDYYHSGLDISRIPSEDVDGQPTVIDMGSEEEAFVSPSVPVPSAPTLIQKIEAASDLSSVPVESASVQNVSDVPAPSTHIQEIIAASDSSSVPVASVKRKRALPSTIKLKVFNRIRDKKGLLTNFDSFPIAEESFFRFVGKNTFVSATVTILVYSMRHFLMTLNGTQCARSLNHESLCKYATVNMLEFLQLCSCIRNSKDTDLIKFNENYVALSSDRPLIASVQRIYGTVAKAYSSSGILRSCIELRLPKKNKDVNIPLGKLQESFDEQMDRLISGSETVLDQSIIFIDIAHPDRRGGTSSTNVNFPVLLKRRKSADQTPVMYQTVGAIYWSPRDSGGDIYHVSIVTRSRTQLESIMYSCFEYTVGPNITSAVSKAKVIEFPAIKKIDHQSFYLKGVIMSLNLLSTTSGVNGRFVFPDTEIIRYGAVGEIKYSDINSLLAFTTNRKRSDSWLEGSTINELLASFAAFLKDDRNVAVDSNALHGMIQCFMKNGFVDDDSYYRFIEIFTGGNLKNLFSVKDSAFHIPINFPEREHWNYGLILPGRKQIIVHDPLLSNERVMNIGSALFEFCKREAGADISKITKWDIKLSLKLPQQKDTVSCGVFTVISSIRAMVLIKQNRFEDLCKSWTFPQLDSQLVDYRRSFAKILLDDHKEDEMQRFVDMFSLKP